MLSGELAVLMKINPDELVARRKEKFYQMGVWQEI